MREITNMVEGWKSVKKKGSVESEASSISQEFWTQLSGESYKKLFQGGWGKKSSYVEKKGLRWEHVFN